MIFIKLIISVLIRDYYDFIRIRDNRLNPNLPAKRVQLPLELSCSHITCALTSFCSFFPKSSIIQSSAYIRDSASSGSSHLLSPNAMVQVAKKKAQEQSE